MMKSLNAPLWQYLMFQNDIYRDASRAVNESHRVKFGLLHFFTLYKLNHWCRSLYQDSHTFSQL